MKTRRKDIAALNNAERLDLLLRGPLSERVAVAVDDCLRINREHYVPQASTWHSLRLAGYCAVCFAGGVMAGTLQAPPDATKHPSNFPPAVNRMLSSLELVRSGRYFRAYAESTVQTFLPSGLSLEMMLPELNGL